MPRDNRCIWRIFVFMSVVVTVWGLWEVCCVASVVKGSGFDPWGVEVCCMFV